MCGVSGIYHLDGAPIDTTALTRMTATMVHRGPDDSGYVVFNTRQSTFSACHAFGAREVAINPDLGFGHRRLSIIDLSPAGRQPMSNEDGTVWVAYNGEIYNLDRKSTRLNSSHIQKSRMPSSA